MEGSRYALREVRDADFESIASLHNAVDPDRPYSAPSLRRQSEGLRRPGQDPRAIVATDVHSGEIVGYALLYYQPNEDDPGRPWIEGEVLPARQGQGIGTLLYDAMLAEARSRGATGVRSSVRENSPAGKAFLKRRSFEERRRSWRSRLELAGADTSRLPELERALNSAGIRVTTLAREGTNDPAVQRGVYEMSERTARDVPHVGTYRAVPFEEFRKFFLDDPNLLADAWFLAKQGDRYVGISYGGREPAQPAVLLQFYTATLREFRHRGIALTLKLKLIEYGKNHGFARIETSNDSKNVAMWTLNQSLGFRKINEMIRVEKLFEETTAAPGPGSDV